MADQQANPRDGQGRFAAGNPGGPGRPRDRSASALRRAAEEAITTDHVSAILRKATRMALEGNLSAMRLVLDRTCGRPAEAPAEGIDLDLALPNMSTASSCNLALDRIVDAICKGTVDRDGAKVMISVIQARLRAIEVSELEDRIAELEKVADNADHGTRRRIRRL